MLNEPVHQTPKAAIPEPKPVIFKRLGNVPFDIEAEAEVKPHHTHKDKLKAEADVQSLDKWDNDFRLHNCSPKTLYFHSKTMKFLIVFSVKEAR